MRLALKQASTPVSYTHLDVYKRQILDYQSENGGSMQQAAMATRRHKDEPSYAEMTDIWAKAMADLREQGIGKSIEELKEHGSQLGSKSDMDLSLIHI